MECASGRTGEQVQRIIQLLYVGQSEASLVALCFAYLS